MASKVMLGRVQTICRLAGSRRPQPSSRGEGLRPLSPASRRSLCGGLPGKVRADAAIKDQHHLDRFSDPQVAHEDRRFNEFLLVICMVPPYHSYGVLCSMDKALSLLDQLK